MQLPTIKRRKPQIRPALGDALLFIVRDGLSITDAAESAGLKPDSLSKALQKPHVKAQLASVRRARLESGTDKAWRIVLGLATGAQSEDVKLKAARTVLEAAGELKGGSRPDDGTPRQLVQIVARSVHVAGERSGVIEALPYSPGEADADDA